MAHDGGNLPSGSGTITSKLGDRSKSPKLDSELPQIVSLFAGAGGLDLGFKQAGFPVAVALDKFAAAIKSHKRNFPETAGHVIDLEKLSSEQVVDIISETVPAGSKIAVIGGPPCQGFSRANTTATADDPRNNLPSIYLKVVEELQRRFKVEFVVFENVLGIRDKKHAANYKNIISQLGRLGFDVSEQEVCSVDFGVPQTRRRVLLAAFPKTLQVSGPLTLKKRSGSKTVLDAIGHIDQEPVLFARGLDPNEFPIHRNHWTMRPKSPRFRPGTVLAASAEFRSFKQLKWDRPSPTIAFGHREIYVHPNGTRRISVYEALLLQGFPRRFVLEGNLSEQIEQVSNAVPPPMAKSVAESVREILISKRPK